LSGGGRANKSGDFVGGPGGTLGNARRAQWRDLDLFRGCHARQRLCSSVVHRSKVETAGGVFQVRADEPAPRIGAGLHRTPW